MQRFPLRRIAWLPFAVLCQPLTCMAQVEAHVHHAFPDVCDGSIIIMGSGFDEVVWSTGDTGPELFAPPGEYGFSVFDNGDLVLEGVRTIGSNGWEVEVQAIPVFDGIQLSGTVELAHCGTSIFNAPCCTPDPAQTTFVVFQDGTPYMPTECIGCSNIQCAYGLVMVSGLPYGHVYTYAINDPACSGLVSYGAITAHSCANLQLELEVADAIGGSTGSIGILEVVPDPTEPLPLSTPVTGVFRLFDNMSGEPVGDAQEGGTALWTDLAPGEYMVVFISAELCQPNTRVVSISGATTTEEHVKGSVDLYPRVAADFIALTLTGGPGTVDVDIFDMKGRRVLRSSRVSSARIPVSQLAPGPYVVMASGTGEVLRARFIKQ